LLAAVTLDGRLTVWDVAEGRERVSRLVPGASSAAPRAGPWAWPALEFMPGGAEVLVIENDPKQGCVVSRWEWETGATRWVIGLSGSFERRGRPLLSPDGRVAAVPTVPPSPPAWVARLVAWLERWTGPGVLYPGVAGETHLVAAGDGSPLGRVPSARQMAFSPDGRLLATLSADEETNLNRVVRIWDVPPHKPLTWFLAGTALVACPLAWLARRRTRRLRRTLT
jgi:hypothetical protein